MPVVLICSRFPLDDHLAGTVVWGDHVERESVSSADEASRRLARGNVNLVLIQRDLIGAVPLVRSLRRQSSTRRLSVVIVAPEEFDSGEVELLEAGANAILRFPTTPEWDERLTRLLEVPVRMQVRFPVNLEILAQAGVAVETVSASAVNLSVSGMLLESSRALRIGEDLDFHFAIPGEEAAVRGCGRVVRLAGRNRYGVEFYGLEGDGVERLQAHLADLTPA
jgi:hypothetical protein